MTADERTLTAAEETADDDGPPPLAPDEILAPGYRVVAHMRRGEDLDVYDLWSEERDCRCIGKTLRPDRVDDRGARSNLLREGRLLTRLTHPHIVRGYEVVAGPPPVVVLETLTGATLAYLIDERARRLPLRSVAYLGLHLCSAVGYLHRQGYLHLDLKPSNIVAAQGIAKLLDLSLARPPGRTRGAVGTDGYMAPEQARGGLLGPATDVWGFGAVLYEAATREPAIELADDEEEQRPNHPIAPIRNHRRLPVAFAAAIDTCLHPDPMRRPTVAALAGVLGDLVEAETLG